MPSPLTAEQFNSLATQAMATAPKGLDKAGFEAYILKRVGELEGGLNKTTASSDQFTDKTDGFMPSVGGTVDFIKRGVADAGHMVRDAYNFGNDKLMNDPAKAVFDVVKGAPHAIGKKVVDYTTHPLDTINAHPAEFLADAAGGLELGAAGVRGAAAVRDVTGGAARGVAKEIMESPTSSLSKSIIKGGVKGAAGAVDARRVAKTAADSASAIPGLERYGNRKIEGNFGGGGAETSHIRYGPEAQPPSAPDGPNPNAGGRLNPTGAREMSIEEVLANHLKEDMAGKAGVSLPPEPGITAAGREGEYHSSGRPAVTAGRHDEIIDRSAGVEDRVGGGVKVEGGGWNGGMSTPPEAVAASTPTPTPTPMHDASSQPWHSGADPGTPDAKSASSLHRYEAEQDALYRMLIEGLGKR